MATQASWKKLATAARRARTQRATLAWERHAHKRGAQVEEAARHSVRTWWSETYPSDPSGTRAMRRRARALRAMGHLTRVERPTPDALVLNIAVVVKPRPKTMTLERMTALLRRAGRSL